MRSDGGRERDGREWAIVPAPDTAVTHQTQSAGIQSVEVGVSVLHALAHFGRPATLGQIASQANMQPSKIHRYLSSFVRTGFAQQTESGEYELGPALRRLGFLAIRQSDPYRIVAERTARLREANGHTVFLAVWGDAGVTIVRWLNGVDAPMISFRLGSTLPLQRSATGRLYLVYLPKKVTAQLLQREPPLSNLSAKLEEIRSSGFSTSVDEILPGVRAFAAPIFGAEGDLFASVTVLETGSAGRSDSEIVRDLLVATADASADASADALAMSADTQLSVCLCESEGVSERVVG